MKETKPLESPEEGKTPNFNENMIIRRRERTKTGKDAHSEANPVTILSERDPLLREAKERGIAISRENMTDIEASTADTGNLLPMVSLIDCPDIFSPQSPLEKEERKLKYLLAVFSDKPELSLYATISSSPAASERIYAELSPSAKEEKTNTAKETAMSVIINDNPLTAICFTC